MCGCVDTIGGLPAAASAPAGRITLASISSSVVVTAATPTDVLNFTLAADRALPGASLHFEFFGDYLNNSAGTRTYQITVLLDGVELYRDTSQGKGASATRRGWRGQFRWQRKSDTTVALGGQFFETNVLTAPDVGLNSFDTTGNNLSPSLALLSAGDVGGVDWTAAQIVQVQIALSAELANHEFRVLGGALELLPPPV